MQEVRRVRQDLEVTFKLEPVGEKWKCEDKKKAKIIWCRESQETIVYQEEECDCVKCC